MKLLSLLLLCISSFANALSYTVSEHPYRFSTYFEMHGKNGFEGRAIKSALAIRTVYDLYDSSGIHEARGIIRVASLGSCFVWGKDIDVYSPEGEKIGFIDGEILTTASAKYTFYDALDQPVGIAFLDYGSSGFVVMDFESRTIGHLRRNFVPDVTDHWDVEIYEIGKIDVRLLKVFSAFVIDFQSSFKEDR